MRRRITNGFLIFGVVLAVYALCLNGTWATDHSTPLVRLDYAILSHDSVALGKVGTFQPDSVDEFAYGGWYYSALAPGTSFLALPFLAVAFTLAGGYTPFGPVLLLSEFFVAITAAAAAYLTYRIARLFFKESTAVFLGFAFAFSTPSWPFATYFFQSDVSAAFVLLAVFLAFKVVRSKEANILAASLCGLAVSAAFTVDYVNAVLAPIIMVFFVLSMKRDRTSMMRAVGAFAPAALFGFVLIALYNNIAFGNPMVTTEQAYLGKATILSGFTNPISDGLTLDLFTLSRGLFVFVPLAAFGLLGYVDALRARESRLEFLLFLAIFLSILLPYAAWYDPSGGISYGPRFILAAIPFVLLPAGFIIGQAKTRLIAVVYTAFLVGAAMNGMAALVTAIPPFVGPNDSPFLDSILPYFLAGRLDTFWAGPSGPFWVAGAAMVLLVATAFPLLHHRRARAAEVAYGTPPAVEGKSVVSQTK